MYNITKSLKCSDNLITFKIQVCCLLNLFFLLQNRQIIDIEMIMYMF